ncbi:hypothetical protein K8R30_02460 [archaeon]|nr:hypothetical protein [archaeon]
MNNNLNSDNEECVYCASKEVFFVQLRKNKSTNKNIYYCEICNRKFTPNDGFKGFRHPPFVIKAAMRAIKNNQSLGQIVQSLNQNFNIRVSRKTILDWKRKFLN